MEVTCQHCKAKLNIPDEKIPREQMVRVSCPKCKGKITLNGRRAELEPSPPVPKNDSDTGKFRLRFIDAKPSQESKEGTYTYEDYSSDEALDFYEEGTKLALVMADNRDHAEKMQKSLRQLGYESISTPDIRDAVGKLRFHHFDLIILVDGFGGQPVENSQITNFLNRLPMAVRRQIFLALMSDKFKTMDNMMAFARSANLVINTKDVDKLQPILKKAISENERFYKIFMDTLVEIGKG
ncbi:MAG: zinc-ribbon domain-containing protein [Desulfobacteraceae bacterium]|jgi:predicted Zn finger-like uncharacterized protein